MTVTLELQIEAALGRVMKVCPLMEENVIKDKCPAFCQTHESSCRMSKEEILSF